jgi:periodic tryptophan protein 2
VADYYQDGSVIATGSLNGKVKLWDTKSFFCFSIFSEHLAAVTGLKFSSRPNTLMSSSLDGTVRCYDTAKYKTFRVLKPDMPTQLTSLAIDQNGEIVFSAGKDPYDIYCWNIQTGNLIDVITGHESVITTLGYSQNNNLLVSGSWDKTVRAHEVYNKKLNNEVMEHNSEITAVAVRSDGKEICVATFKGELYFWDPEQGQVIGVIDVKKDV